MTNPHRVFFILLGVAAIAALFMARPSTPQATLVAQPENPDDAQLGMSATHVYDGGPAPRHLVVNVPLMFPPPLAAMLPTISTKTGT